MDEVCKMPRFLPPTHRVTPLTFWTLGFVRFNNWVPNSEFQDSILMEGGKRAPVDLASSLKQIFITLFEMCNS